MRTLSIWTTGSKQPSMTRCTRTHTRFAGHCEHWIRDLFKLLSRHVNLGWVFLSVQSVYVFKGAHSSHELTKKNLKIRLNLISCSFNWSLDQCMRRSLSFFFAAFRSLFKQAKSPRCQSFFFFAFVKRCEQITKTRSTMYTHHIHSAHIPKGQSVFYTESLIWRSNRLCCRNEKKELEQLLYTTALQAMQLKLIASAKRSTLSFGNVSSGDHVEIMIQLFSFVFWFTFTANK